MTTPFEQKYFNDVDSVSPKLIEQGNFTVNLLVVSMRSKLSKVRPVYARRYNEVNEVMNYTDSSNEVVGSG